MGYIKFNLSRVFDENGRIITAKVNKMDTDMPKRMTPIYIYHELSRQKMKLDKLSS